MIVRRRSKFLAVLLLLAACGFGTPQRLEAQSAPTNGVDPVLHPGDMVRITVWLKPELSGEFPVLPSGSIGDPFYMPVVIAGMPLTSAASRIESHVAQIESSPRVLIEPLFRIVIGGEVRQPDLYFLSPQMTVMQALVQAGGPTDRAHRERLRIIRDGVESQWATSRAYTEPLRSGDQIFLDQNRSILRDYVLPAIGVAGSIASILRWARY